MFELNENLNDFMDFDEKILKNDKSKKIIDKK